MNTLNFERFIANEALAARDAIQSGVAKLRDDFLMQIEILKAQRIAEQCTDQMEEFLETIAYVYDTTGVIPELVEQVSDFSEPLSIVEGIEREIAEITDKFGSVSVLTDLQYGCYDLTAEQRDYLDWQRETMQTRESDRPY